MNKKFQIEHQYQKYLKLVKLKEEDMPIVQRTEMRRAFFGGWGQLMLLLKDELLKVPAKQQLDTMNNMLEQCREFWKQEQINANKDSA